MGEVLLSERSLGERTFLVKVCLNISRMGAQTGEELTSSETAEFKLIQVLLIVARFACDLIVRGNLLKVLVVGGKEFELREVCYFELGHNLEHKVNSFFRI